jgi:MYXO-CTERM domain-containing protein
MKRLVAAVAALLMLCAAGRSSAASIVVTFDDLPGQGVVPDGYGGINWQGHWSYYHFDQSPYNAHSGTGRVYTDYSQPVANGSGENTFAFVAPQHFLGAWFSGYDFASVRFNLYLNGQLVHTTNDLAMSGTPMFLGSGYAGPVDQVGVWSNKQDFYVMDDVTYGQGNAPEPASWTLAGLGAVGLLALVRRRRAAVVDVPLAAA